MNSDKRFKYEDVKSHVEGLGLKLLSTEYKNMRTKLKFKCKCGNIFERDLSGIKYKNRHTCNSCSKVELRESYMKPLEDVINLCEQSGLKYIDRYVIDKTRSTMLIVECEEHGKMEVYYSNLRQRKGCPECNAMNLQNSKISQEVEQWLIRNNKNYIKEKKFEQCRRVRPLPFDFYIKDENTLIEVDGEHHYTVSYFADYPKDVAEDNLVYTKENDEIKNTFAREKGIKLIRLPYWKRESMGEVLDKFYYEDSGKYII